MSEYLYTVQIQLNPPGGGATRTFQITGGESSGDEAIKEIMIEAKRLEDKLVASKWIPVIVGAATASAAPRNPPPAPSPLSGPPQGPGPVGGPPPAPPSLGGVVMCNKVEIARSREKRHPQIKLWCEGESKPILLTGRDPNDWQGAIKLVKGLLIGGQAFNEAWLIEGRTYTDNIRWLVTYEMSGTYKNAKSVANG